MRLFGWKLVCREFSHYTPFLFSYKNHCINVMPHIIIPMQNEASGSHALVSVKNPMDDA